MDYLGDKLSAAHSQVSGWVGSVRRSLQGALTFVSSGVERAGGRGGDAGEGEEGGAFKRTASLRLLANRSRESFHRFSLRSQQRLSLRRRTTANSPTTPSTPSSEHVKQTVSGQEEAKDTDVLVQETDSQYGTWDTGLRTDDSLTPATPSSDDNLTPSPRKPTPPHSPVVSTDTPTSPAPWSEEQTQPLSLPEIPSALLDSSVLRSRVQLSKRSSRRAPPSRAARQSAALSQLIQGSEVGAGEWRYRDSSEDKVDSAIQEKEEEAEEEEEEEEEQTPRGPQSTSTQPQRVSLFPGMDPSALMAQLKKRGDAGTQPDGPAPSPSQLSRSPKSPFLPRASRVLPPAGSKENGEESSPQWLKELKSKKRLSQYETDG